MDAEHYAGLREAKRINYRQIYKIESVEKVLDGTVKPVMQRLYLQMLADLKAGKKSSPIYKHHIDFVMNHHYGAKDGSYLETEPNQIVIDYLASMTDEYCAELYQFLFPRSSIEFKYHGYFEDLM